MDLVCSKPDHRKLSLQDTGKTRKKMKYKVKVKSSKGISKTKTYTDSGINSDSNVTCDGSSGIKGNDSDTKSTGVAAIADDDIRDVKSLPPITMDSKLNKSSRFTSLSRNSPITVETKVPDSPLLRTLSALQLKSCHQTDSNQNSSFTSSKCSKSKSKQREHIRLESTTKNNVVKSRQSLTSKTGKRSIENVFVQSIVENNSVRWKNDQTDSHLSERYIENYKSARRQRYYNMAKDKALSIYDPTNQSSDSKRK